MKHLYCLTLVLLLSLPLTADTTAAKQTVTREDMQQALKNFRQNPGQQAFHDALAILQQGAAGEDAPFALTLQAMLHHDACKNLLQQAEQAAEKEPRIRFAVANMWLALGEYARAVELYGTLADGNPKWPCPLRHKAEALYRLERYSDALRAIQSCLAINQEHLDAQYWAAKILFQLGKDTDALAAIDKAVAMLKKSGAKHHEDLENAEIYRLKGAILRHMGKEKEAETAFQQAEAVEREAR